MDHDYKYGKQLAQDALGFGRQFVKKNNGIKEDSIFVMSALIGLFPDDLDDLLVKELNQYGGKRGDVAHKSWKSSNVIFDTAEIERDKILKILELTKKCFEVE